MRKTLSISLLSLFGLLMLPQWGHAQNAQLNTVNNFSDTQLIQLGGKPSSHGLIINRDGNTIRSGLYQYTGPSTTTIAGVSSGTAMIPATIDFSVGDGGYRGMLQLSSPLNQRIGPGIKLNAAPVTGGVEFWLEQNGNFVLRNSATTGSAYLDFPNQDLFFRGTNNANSMMLTKEGRLGIGTTNPTQRLHLAGDMLLAGPGNFTGVGTQATLHLGGVGNSLSTAFGDKVRLAGWHGISLGTSPSNQYTERLVIDAAGKVGIGINAPETQLHVNATSPILSTGNGGGFKFRDWKAGAVAGTDDWHIYAKDGVANIHKVMVGDMMSFNAASGNVGVGTQNPGHKLDVNGNIGGLDIVSGGINSWIFHTPDGDNRKTLYIAPSVPAPTYWNWGAGFAFKETGDLIIRNKLGIGYFPTETVAANLEIRSATPVIRITNTATNVSSNSLVGAIEFPTTESGTWKAKIAANIGASANEPYLTFHTGTQGSEQMRIAQSGNVGIGTTTPGNYKLAVEGAIGAREVEVKTGSWADFVFADEYKLPSLTDVEAYIKEKNHLPDIPSEAEVKEKGIALGAMNAKLLQKIEELTLYIIDQQKRIERLEDQASKK